MPDKLSEFPWVTVRIGCDLCGRRGEYRLARLAAAYGPEIALDALLDRIAHDCPWRHPNERRAREYTLACGACFLDLNRPTEPPDLPPSKRKLKVILGGKP